MKSNVLIFLFFSASIISTTFFSCNTDQVQVNSIGIKIVKIPAGSFLMGDSCGNWDEMPVHKVFISRSFYISETEVTAKQFQEFRKDYRFADEKFAIGVTWYKANEFCKWISDKEGINYRVPTESEWEYVCGNENDWDLKNMLNPTLEWCYDWYGPYIDTAQVDPIGVEYGIAKVVRGGLPDIFIKEYLHPEKFY